MNRGIITSVCLLIISILAFFVGAFVPATVLLILAIIYLITNYIPSFRYVASRSNSFIVTMLIIVTLSFFMMRFAPGGPFDSERPLNPIAKANILKMYGMDKSLIMQYFTYIKNLSEGDLGSSLINRDYTVNQLIFNGAPNSFILGILAILLSVIIGIPMGVLSVIKRNSKIDYSIRLVTMVGIAVPNFVMSALLSLVIGVYLRWLPVAGWDGPSYVILPTIALALPQIAIISRLTRGAMIEVLAANYIRTAKAKGLPYKTIILRHALRGSLLPVVSYLGPAIAGITTGSTIIESIFAIPGIGKYFVDSAINRDYSVVLGVIIFYSLLLIIMNFVVDTLYGFLDPKISTGGK